MQRQIKFRGKSTKSGKWLYGDLIHNRGEVYIADDTQGHTDFEVIPSTVGQYTGFTLDDGEGTEIYEDDILRYIYDERNWGGARPMLVVYDEGAFWARERAGNTCELLGTRVIGCENVYEVVGNIHDNPELLKGGDHAD